MKQTDAGRARDLLARTRSITERNERRQFVVAAAVAAPLVIALGLIVDLVEEAHELASTFVGLSVVLPLFVQSWRSTRTRPRIRPDRLLPGLGLAIAVTLAYFGLLHLLIGFVGSIVPAARFTLSFAIGYPAFVATWYRLDRWRSGRRR